MGNRNYAPGLCFCLFVVVVRRKNSFENNSNVKGQNENAPKLRGENWTLVQNFLTLIMTNDLSHYSIGPTTMHSLYR